MWSILIVLRSFEGVDSFNGDDMISRFGEDEKFVEGLTCTLDDGDAIVIRYLKL